MRVRVFQPDDETAVIALWGVCDLIRPWNDPQRDIARKLLVQPELFLVGEIDGIRLVFKGGKVVEASADKNEKYLLSMLDLDPGARRLGELGIGTNFGIQQFIKNILYDEKIGGTIHLALGESYEETGGKNKSALHWDMIKDLRKGGALYVHGKVFQKDGKFVGGF